MLTKTLPTALLAAGLFALPMAHAAADDAAPVVPVAPAASIATSVNSARPYTPMTQSDRVRQWEHSTFSVEAAVRAAAGAAISQGMNTPGEWGQGAEGYARRFASDYGEDVIRQTIMFSAGDLLDEDNRYFRSGYSGTGPRVRYAVESTFLARRRDGHRRLSYSRLAGVIGTAFLSREWQPRSTDHVHNALLSTGTVFGTEIGFNIAREFLPKIFHTALQPSDSR